MKRVITILLALIMCVSLCACGGDRDVASPDGEDAENADTNIGDTPIDDSENADDTNTVGDASGDNAANDGDSSGQSYTEAPANSEESTIETGDLDVDINYGSGMTVTEMPEDDMVSVDYGDGSKLYIQDVTDIYDPNTVDPSQFLYEYAYESCVELVSATFGQITQFNGEYPISVTDNELYGYGAHMTCDYQIQVYAFIKLVDVDDGYAVMIGICDEANMNVFDNVTID